MNFAESKHLNEKGYCWFRNALSDVETEKFESLFTPAGTSQRLTRIDTGTMLPVQRLATQLLPASRAVRTVLFNKDQHQNWSLPWHQDRVISLAERHETTGYSNWTRKNGVWHCEPPVGILEDLIFAHIYCDDVFDETGPMDIAEASHNCGRLTSENLKKLVQLSSEHKCVAKRKDVLFVKALSVHRSNASCVPQSRRVVRVDFSAAKLPAPLQWSAE